MTYERSMYEGKRKYACAPRSLAASAMSFSSEIVLRLKSFGGGSAFTKIESGFMLFFPR